MDLLTSQDWPRLLEELLRNSPQPLVVILGPTASGKTGFSLEIAEHIRRATADHGWRDAEVVNADSRQFYRGMDIGTAKVTEEERRGVPHHLLDIVEPNEEVSIAMYKERACAVIDDCHRRNVVPLLVGGSMLYISAVVDGLEPLPKADPALRKKIRAEYDKDDGWSLYERLAAIDPQAASSFERQNKVYVVRAMELYEMTGRPPSTLKKTIPPPYQVLQFGLFWPRETLTRRIDERTREMLDAGWIEEVEGLLDRGSTAADSGMKSHGYREILAWLRSEEQDKEALAERISAKVRQYAKRQMTWWGNDDRIRWIDAATL